MSDEPILFYSANRDFGDLSNFAEYPIKLNGKTWPSTEHYYQAQKYAGTDIAEEIREAPKPIKAFKIAHAKKAQMRSDWDAVKDNVMRRAVTTKFTQHRVLREFLLATGDRELVEHSSRDAYWGDAPDGSGKNMLGQILQEVRATLREENN